MEASNIIEASTKSMWYLTILMAVALVGCRTQGGMGATPEIVGKVTEACRFLPSDMTGWWASDRPDSGCVIVRCGRRFGAPKDLGIGPYEGVTIEDYGERAVPGDRVQGFRGTGRHVCGVETLLRVDEPTLGGMRSPEDGLMRWAAVWQERFLVLSTSESLLGLALQRPGQIPESILGELKKFDGHLSEFACSYSSGQQWHLERCAAVMTSPLRLMLWPRRMAIADNGDVLRIGGVPGVPRECHNGYYCIENVQEEQSGARSWDCDLMLMTVFGIVVAM